MRFRKKPIEIEAMRIPPIHAIDERLFFEDWIDARRGNREMKWRGAGLVIQTLKGEMTASLGDWVIRGVAGELFSCQADGFAQTYDPVGPSPIDVQ